MALLSAVGWATGARCVTRLIYLLAAFAAGCGDGILIVLELAGSMVNGPPSICTLTRYSSAAFDGTRHEYRQVKPQPYSKLPFWTTSPFAVVMVNSGGFGR